MTPPFKRQDGRYGKRLIITIDLFRSRGQVLCGAEHLPGMSWSSSFSAVVLNSSLDAQFASLISSMLSADFTFWNEKRRYKKHIIPPVCELQLVPLGKTKKIVFNNLPWQAGHESDCWSRQKYHQKENWKETIITLEKRNLQISLKLSLKSRRGHYYEQSCCLQFSNCNETRLDLRVEVLQDFCHQKTRGFFT